MKYQNIQALKQLIQDYKNITLEQLKKFDVFDAKKIMKKLTGLGTTKCKLCHSLFQKFDIDDEYYDKDQIEFLCNRCVHAANPGDRQRKTGYCFSTTGRQEILNSKTPEELYKNIQLRIDYLENKLLPIAIMGEIMRNFKIVKVKRYQEESNKMSVHEQWEKQRDINSWQEKVLRISPEGYVERLEIKLQSPDDNSLNEIEINFNWIKDDNYKIVYENETKDNPWEQLIKRYILRNKKPSNNKREK